MHTTTRPLTAAELRLLIRKHAKLLSVLLDTLPCGYDLGFDAAVAATARLLVDHPPVFCDIVRFGTDLTADEVEETPWPQVVGIGCEIIEATREAWRLAWPNGFLQAMVCEELRPYSTFVCGAAR